MRVRGDERGQSVQIGAVLLFAVLIIVFSTYQAFVVPNQNRQVEFAHNQQVQRDMVELRNAILTTKVGGDDGFAEVALGTTFPARLVAVNPAPPSGTLATTEPRPIVIRDEDGDEITSEVCPGDDIETRFLEYRPNYALYDGAGTIRLEYSYLYHDFGEETVSLTNQTLVRGDELQIVPLTNAYSEGGTRTVAVEPKAGRVDTSERSDVEVTLPTRASEATWEERLAAELDPSDVTVTQGAAGRNVTLTLEGDTTVNCGPVGIGATPPSGPRGGGTDEINPASPGDVELQDERRNGNTVTLEFNNTAGENNFTEGRINFYDAQSGNAPTEGVIRAAGEPDSATLPIGGEFRTFDPDINLPGQGTVTNVEITLNNNVNPNDWFVITLKLETGETGLYFVSLK